MKEELEKLKKEIEKQKLFWDLMNKVITGK